MVRWLSLLIVLVPAIRSQAQCTVDIPEDSVTVYFGYQPMNCAPIDAIATGDDPIAYSWSNGATTSTITVCDTSSTWYFVTITDDAGCTATDSVFVNVVDVRCGNDLRKVLVCHVPPGNPANAHTICISSSAVPAHLSHGCHPGDCGTAPPPAGEELQLQVSPNPMQDQVMVQFGTTIAQRVTLVCVNANGRTIATIFEGDLPAGASRAMWIDRAELPEGAGIVWLKLQGGKSRKGQRLMLIER